MRRWRKKRKNWIPEESSDPRTAATRGKTTKDIRNLEGYAAMYRRQGIDCEIDHIRPLSKGGLHVIENLWIILRSMNKGGPQTRTELEMYYARRAAAQDRTRIYETWPNS